MKLPAVITRKTHAGPSAFRISVMVINGVFLEKELNCNEWGDKISSFDILSDILITKFPHLRI